MDILWSHVLRIVELAANAEIGAGLNPPLLVMRPHGETQCAALKVHLSERFYRHSHQPNPPASPLGSRTQNGVPFRYPSPVAMERERFALWTNQAR